MTIKTSWIKRKERYGKSGFKNPEERKRKISENTKKALARPEVKLKIMKRAALRKEKYGYINSPEARKKLSETWKRKWANGEVTELQRTHIRGHGIKTQFKKGHIVTEKTREAVRKSRANQIFPKKDTSIEVKIQNFLKELQIEFFTHQRMNIKHSYQCDILIPSMNMVLECDGNYWHKYPIGTEIDHTRTSELISKGFKVLRLWEKDIKVMELNKFKEKLEFAIIL